MQLTFQLGKKENTCESEVACMVPSALRNSGIQGVGNGVLGCWGDGMWGWGVVELDASGMSEEWSGMELGATREVINLGVSERRQELGELSAKPTIGQPACICLPPIDSCLAPQWALDGPHEDSPAVCQLTGLGWESAPDLYSGLPGKLPAGTACYL